MDPFENLANAVVMQAVKDWRDSVATLKINPRYDLALNMKADCERFFLSWWFEVLTDVNGGLILQKLKKEANIHDF